MAAAGAKRRPLRGYDDNGYVIRPHPLAAPDEPARPSRARFGERDWFDPLQVPHPDPRR